MMMMIYFKLKHTCTYISYNAFAQLHKLHENQIQIYSNKYINLF